jgi:hypothetical protein
MNTMPNIIPAPQKWTGAKGYFNIRKASLSVPNKQLSQLKPVLDLFRQNLVTIGITEKKSCYCHSQQPKRSNNSI